MRVNGKKSDGSGSCQADIAIERGTGKDWKTISCGNLGDSRLYSLLMFPGWEGGRGEKAYPLSFE